MTLKDLTNIVKCDLFRYLETYKYRGEKPNIFKIGIEAVFLKAGFQAVLLFRIANYLYKKELNILPWIVTRVNQVITAAEIEYNAEIGPGFLITHPAGIVIGRGVVAGKNLTLFQGITLGVKNWKEMKYPSIADNVVIFSGAKVLGNIFIGEGSWLGANVVVLADVPKNSTIKPVFVSNNEN